MNKQTVEQKLQSARTRLILDKPFLGALILRLPMVEANADWCPTTATDAKTFYYNHEYIDQLKLDECQFILSHEALHCALLHFSRRGHRSKLRWDVSCDYAVNSILINDGMTYPPDALYLRDFDNMTAEEIYHCIDENPLQETLDKHLFDPQDKQQQGGQKDNSRQGESDQKANPGGSGEKNKDCNDKKGNDNKQDQNNRGDSRSDPDQNKSGDARKTQAEQATDQSADTGTEQQSQGGDAQQGESAPVPQPDGLTQREIETLSTQWQQRSVSAAQTARQAGKLEGNLARMIDINTRSALPWRQLLDRYVSLIARDDYNYSRPTNRRGDPAIFAGLRSAELNIALALDVSGSISNDELNQFVSEINAIKARFRCQVTLLACDTQLADGCPWIFNPWEEMKYPETIKGGGGTDFKPVFSYLEQRDIQPDVLVYFTDLQGYFPVNEPTIPVIWLVKGHATPPWGQRVQLN